MQISGHTPHVVVLVFVGFLSKCDMFGQSDDVWTTWHAQVCWKQSYIITTCTTAPQHSKAAFCSISCVVSG